MQPVDEVVRACLEIRAAESRRDEWARVREEWVRRMSEQGMTAQTIALTVQRRLRERGLSDADMVGLGVSVGAIKLALSRPR